MPKTNFVNGDPSQGTTGTVVTAEFLNAVNNHRHRGLNEDGDGAIDYAPDTGVANAYVIALSPALTAHVVGMPIHFMAANANTGASTLNVNGLGVKDISKNFDQPLAAGDIKAGQIITVVWDGVDYQVISQGENFREQSFSNLIKNGSFESWSEGTNTAPDGWTLTGTGATITKESAVIKHGTYSAKLNTDGVNEAVITKSIFNNAYKGRKMTFGCWVNASIANRARLALYDTDGANIERAYSSYHPGGSAFEFLVVTKTIQPDATDIKVEIRLESGVSTNVYVDGAMCVEGALIPSFTPHPADNNIIAQKNVLTNENTTSLSFVDLTTPQAVSIHLPETMDVLVSFGAAISSSAGNIAATMGIFRDGVDQGYSAQGGASATQSCFSAYIDRDVPPGTREYRAKFIVNGATIGSFSHRRLIVIAMPIARRV